MYPLLKKKSQSPFNYRDHTSTSPYSHAPPSFANTLNYRNKNNLNESKPKSEDIDLQCDEVLFKPKNLQDTDFICNETLSTVNANAPKTYKAKEMQLKCNEHMGSQVEIDKMNEAKEKIESVLRHYQNVVIRQQEYIMKLQSEKEALLVRNYHH